MITLQKHPLSMEGKVWMMVLILSLFSVLIIKNWYTELKTPNRVERKK